MPRLKRFLLDWSPPALRRWLRRVGGRPWYSFGPTYSTWAEAASASTGYAEPGILRRARDAASKVKRGEALYERDAVCFYRDEYRWPAIACLLAVAAEGSGGLAVLDFGGALGSFYTQHRRLLSRLSGLRWAVVEQPHFVECGRAEFQTDSLTFHAEPADALRAGAFDVLFLSGVLQYLENPYDVIARVSREVNAPYLLIDRTVFLDGPDDILRIQSFGEGAFRASYPAWFLSRRRFDAAVQSEGYRLIIEFPTDDEAPLGEFRGVFLKRG